MKGESSGPTAEIEFSPSSYGKLSISSINLRFLYFTVIATTTNANNLKSTAHLQYLTYYTGLQIR
ncbi:MULTISPECIES: hypothetical protein, partial [unclassified Akkermansia]